MIELVKGFPANVIAVVVKGRVTGEECRTVLRPAIGTALLRYPKLRLYYEIRSRFPGAGWEELSIGLDHRPDWERIAVITDTAWVRQTVNALTLFLAPEIRVFTTSETQ